MSSLTKEQIKIIKFRGNNNILVSAAAGSGKTSVLINRILDRIINEKLNITDFLIITYTNNAVFELKKRLIFKLEEKLKEKNNIYSHLKKQLLLIDIADICTIHSFCNKIISENKNILNIAYTTKTIEDEKEMLFKNSLDVVLNREYKEHFEEMKILIQNFNDYNNSNSKVKNNLRDIIKKLYDKSKEYFDFKELKNKILLDYNTETWLLDYQNIIKEKVKYILNIIEEILYEDFNFEETIDNYLKDIKNCFKGDYQFFKDSLECKNIFEYFFNNEFKSFKLEKRNKGYKENKEIIDKISYYKDIYYNIYEKDIKNNICINSIEEQKKIILKTKKIIEKLLDLVEKLNKEFLFQKEKKNIIDYNDMEHLAFNLLSKNDNIAEFYKLKYVEILIDEYQDVSPLQNDILNLILNKNGFFIGDIKQSIYGFRGSNPELFYDRQKECKNKGRYFCLNKNFRSRKEILDSCNSIFSAIITKDICKIDYDESKLFVGNKKYIIDLLEKFIFEFNKEKNKEIVEKLSQESKDIINNLMKTKEDYLADKIKEETLDVILNKCEEITNQINNKTEIILFNKKINEKDIEGIEVVNKINEIVNNFYLTNGEKARYSDITILFRDRKKINRIKKIFKDHNIPFYDNDQKDFLNCKEVDDILNYLKIIDNSYQDIELVSFLKSFFCKLSDEDLVKIKINSNSKDYFYSLINEYILKGKDNNLVLKLKKIISKLNFYKNLSNYIPIYKLIFHIIKDYKYKSYIKSLYNGDVIFQKINILIKKSKEICENNPSIYYFINYINDIKLLNLPIKNSLNKNEKSDSINISTIHSSKGLEYSIVIMPFLGDNINTKTDEKLIFDYDYGIAVKYLDVNSRIEVDNIYRNYIKEKIEKKCISEEIRILYVALTRVKEKLILIASKTITSDLKNNNKVNYLHLKNNKTYIDWILLGYAKNKKNFNLIKKDFSEICENKGKNRESNKESNKENNINKNIVCNFTYKYSYLKNQKKIISVSEIKDNEEKNYNYSNNYSELTKEEHRIKGLVYHKFLENFNYKLLSKDNIENVLIKEFDKFKQLNIFEEKYLKLINLDDIKTFLNCDISNNIIEASKNNLLFREKFFMIYIPSIEFYKNADKKDKLIVQGVIDLYFIKNNKITIIDYKTDNIDNEKELINKYNVQLYYYSKALKMDTNKDIENKYIYSFSLNKYIKVD